MCNRVAGFQRRNNAFGATQIVKRSQRLLVGDADIFRTTYIFQKRMLGADAGVVQARTHAVRFGDLAIRVLQHIGAVTVQHTGYTALQRRRVLAAVHAFTSGFNANQSCLLEGNVGVKNAHRIRAAAHTRQHGIGLSAQMHTRHLCDAFFADHALEIAHHHRIRMRPGHGADDVESVFYIRHPIAQGFVECVFQGAAARFDRHHSGTQQFHAVDIRALAFHVFAAHVHHTLQTIAGTNGGGGNAVLSGTGFSDHARLAHAFGQHGLADGVVDFVGAGVVEVFALQVDLSAAHFTAHASGMVDGGRAADKMRQFGFEFGDKGRVVLVICVGFFEFFDRVRQCFADKAATELAKVPAGIGLLVSRHVVSL